MRATCQRQCRLLVSPGGGWQLKGSELTPCGRSHGMPLTLAHRPPSPTPAVESHLDHFLHDHMAAEVVTR